MIWIANGRAEMVLLIAGISSILVLDNRRQLTYEFTKSGGPFLIISKYGLEQAGQN